MDTGLPCLSNSCPLLAMSSNHLIFCRPLLLPSISPSIGVFFFSHNEWVLRIRWPKYQSFSISPSSEYSGLLSFRIDWFDLRAVQGSLTVSYTSKQTQTTKSSALQSLTWLISGKSESQIQPGSRGCAPNYSSLLSLPGIRANSSSSR